MKALSPKKRAPKIRYSRGYGLKARRLPSDEHRRPFEGDKKLKTRPLRNADEDQHEDEALKKTERKGQNSDDDVFRASGGFFRPATLFLSAFLFSYCIFVFFRNSKHKNKRRGTSLPL